jgi:ATP-dependent protease ClpP protease subunit
MSKKLLRISGLITPDFFEKTKKRISELEDGDILVIWIDSPGGSLETALKIRNELNQAVIEKYITIVTVGYRKVCSAATLIFLLGTYRVVYKKTRFMIHAPVDEETKNITLSKDKISFLKKCWKIQFLSKKILCPISLLA